MKHYLLSVLLLCCAIPASASQQSPEIQLFNGKNFENLFIFVGEGATKDEQLWKVEKGVLRCTGVGKGYIRTTMAYSDYILRFDWRWPDGAGNSGVMLNIVNGDLLWPKSFEAQLKGGYAGDFTSFSDARNNEEIVSRNPNGVSTGRFPRPGPSKEKPLGEWNTFEITVNGGTIVLNVNGSEVNRITGANPSGGMIGFQAEGKPIDFRNITLTSLPPAKDLFAPMPK